MENDIIESMNEINLERFDNLVEAKKVYTEEEILDSYLQYEGIIGYTNKIIEAVKCIYELELD